MCHSLRLFFSYFLATFQIYVKHSKESTKFFRRTVEKLTVRHSERCAPVLEPVSLFLLLQLSPSAGSCLSFSFTPPYALTSLHPSLSRRPGVGMGQLKPAYTPSARSVPTRPQIHMAHCSSVHTLPFTAQKYTKISSSQHPAVSAIRNIPA